jgi:hypothetical protein
LPATQPQFAGGCLFTRFLCLRLPCTSP